MHGNMNVKLTKELFTERYELDLYIYYRLIFIFKGQRETNFD